MRFHTFYAASCNALLSIYFDTIECTKRCEIHSSERKIALTSRKPISFALQNLCLLKWEDVPGGGVEGYLIVK